jgi:hypothetical protein
LPRPVGFAFLREGSSDDGLVPHLRSLIVRCGASEVVGSSRDYKGSIEDRLRSLVAEGSAVSMVFVHRDSDGPDPSARHLEVLAAAGNLNFSSCVAVVPVQELEAWLLLDEMAIRDAVGRRSGGTPLDLPPLNRIEETRFPKEILKRACLAASETSGRRRDQETRRFPQRRRTLLERLDIDGPVRQLPSWIRLERDIKITMDALARRGGVA